MKIHIYFMAVIAVLALSCSSGANKEALADSAAVVAPDVYAGASEPIPASGDTLSNISDTTMQDVLQGNAPAAAPTAYGLATWDKKMIRTADITLQVNNYDSFDNALHRQLVQFGAYISQEKQTGSGAGVENDVTIKVPVQQFEQVLNSFTGKGVVVKNKEVSATEVTAEVLDTKARNETKKLVRERYMELMGKAGKMKDVLTIQQELNNLQVNIESAQGRINYLENEAAYSTIHLKYYGMATALEEGKKPGYWTRLLQELESGASVLGNVLLFFIGMWPLAVLGAVVWVIYKKKWGGQKGNQPV
ncbi:hypothetical protein HNQ91_003233 [Filimonas zeae]|uniref:DUF4349 domain-containing protein n=1 Tax=Filimonas zeae TaxID=1737353 RepID=A0A917IYL3_9BACT|nr:DUF4349 domain-containing protein [Filimonas zeae]MDR6340168.1 hypothetical protein [Filimonas zeae]GGH71466.1 hypothetical protein GCM10011379_30840 [Filimonas zeae]